MSDDKNVQQEFPEFGRNEHVRDDGQELGRC